MRRKITVTALIALAVVLIVFTAFVAVHFDALMLGALLRSQNIFGETVHSAEVSDKANIIIFGALKEGFADYTFIHVADEVIETYALKDEINLILFDIDPNGLQSITAGLKNVSIFDGRSQQVGALLNVWMNMQGLNNATVMPVVFYMNKQGKVVASETGIYQKEAIVNHLPELIGHSVVDDLPDDRYVIAVLADNGATYEERKNQILERQEILRTSEKQIDTLNFIRFLAGLPADIETTMMLNHQAQLGAALLSVSGYGHTPSQPDYWDDETYAFALFATEYGCIAYSSAAEYDTLISPDDTLLLGWMGDEDNENIIKLGHRRWLLNPDLKYVGFGAVDKYYAQTSTYYRFLNACSAEQTRSELVSYQAIAYPSGIAFPSEYFRGNFPWSIILNPYYYNMPDENDVTVTLFDGGRTFSFSTERSDGFFNVDNSGINNCIIFRPDGIDAYYGAYTVSVSGIKANDGTPVSIEYTVEFF